ncbi:hypothetical protein BGW38_003149 [Lunasporangiospora selenospora]|uniref:Pre-mRNA-splicing factor CWC26 n=1 Tax=Lunasporangiospora selenospora TaxID=979761 RepID=A0A9P6KCE6_9FUNG|nr:hypothetical protein BGW38_003149 [Lunasporangiospora selenospora]
MSSTQDYLKKYMSKPASLEEYKKRKLKKKPKSTSTVKRGNFAIHDEDEMSWKNNNASDSASDEESRVVVEVKQPEAPAYKSSSSSWATVREGEAGPSREETLQRNVIPEWDDVEFEDERPAIAGIVEENEAMGRLSRPKKKSWKEPKAPVRTTPARSPSPPSSHRGRPPSPGPSRRIGRPQSARSPSPVPQQKRQRSPSRSLSPRSRSRSGSPSVERMSSGVRAGLRSGADVRKDMERAKRDHEDRIKALDPSKSGRDAETVLRDSKGRKIDRTMAKIEAAAARQKEVEQQERLMEWGKGTVQREEEADKKKREKEEGQKPFARFRDDADLNEELKERDRWNDPAAMFLSGTKKKAKKSNAPKFPLYQGNYPSNRYNIRPGYRWDGVDRSNGFEKDFFNRMNTKKHNAYEAHMWSVEDM